MEITYLRLKDTIGSPKGTFGVWMDGNIPFGTGLEPVIPIIPVGVYQVSWFLSPKRNKYVFLISNVPDHAGVEIHIGNILVDTDGCMLIGQGFSKAISHGVVDDGVIYSTVTFNLLKSKVGVLPWTLLIKEV